MRIQLMHFNECISSCAFHLIHFSERMFEVLEQLYGSIPIQLRLCKCHPPIPGFAGTVSLERWRRQPS